MKGCPHACSSFPRSTLIAAPGDAARTARAGRSRGEPAGPSPLRGGPVLVVDDDPTVQEVVARDLTRAGYDVMVAGDGLLSTVRGVGYRFDPADVPATEQT